MSNTNEAGSSLPELQFGAGMGLGQEPPTEEVDESAAGVDEPTKKTNPEAPEAKVEDGGNGEHSARLIAELGEDRKTVVGQLVKLAKSSPEAYESLKELMADDPRMERLVKSKFGDDYDSLIKGDKPGKPIEHDEAYKARVKAEVLLERDTELKQKQLKTYAENKGFDVDEVAKLEKYAEALEATDDDDDYAITIHKAGMLVNQTKANAKKISSTPVGGEVRPDPEKAPVSISARDERVAKNLGWDVSNLGERLRNVKEKLQASPDGGVSFKL